MTLVTKDDKNETCAAYRKSSTARRVILFGEREALDRSTGFLAVEVTQHHV